jgi:predicted aconitase
MKLTVEEQRILDGERGEALQFAANILYKLGEACEADCFIPVVDMTSAVKVYTRLFFTVLSFFASQGPERGGANNLDG